MNSYTTAPQRPITPDTNVLEEEAKFLIDAFLEGRCDKAGVAVIFMTEKQTVAGLHGKFHSMNLLDALEKLLKLAIQQVGPETAAEFVQRKFKEVPKRAE